MDSYVTKVRPGGPRILQTSADPQCLNSQAREERVLCSTLLSVMSFSAFFYCIFFCTPKDFPHFQNCFSHGLTTSPCLQAQQQAPTGCAGTSQSTARGAAAPPCPPDPAGTWSLALPGHPAATSAANWTPVVPGPGKKFHVLRLTSKANFIGSFYVGSFE